MPRMPCCVTGRSEILTAVPKATPWAAVVPIDEVKLPLVPIICRDMSAHQALGAQSRWLRAGYRSTDNLDTQNVGARQYLGVRKGRLG